MDGFLNILKDKGFTSHDAVSVIRRHIRGERAGHLGTLDPLAVGVLPVAIGAYRRLAEYLLSKDKEYLAEFTFGVTTESGDMEGQVIRETDASGLDPVAVSQASREFTGVIQQVPPIYSAVKSKGKKLYELAREGIDRSVPAREIVVRRFQLVGWKAGRHPKGLFRLEVSSGTYVRSLASSLGDRLKVGGAVSYLLRTRAGRFCLKDSIPLGMLRRYHRQGRFESLLSDPLEVLKDFPIVKVRPEAMKKVVHGMELSFGDFASVFATQSSPVIAVLDPENEGELPRVVAVLSHESGRIKYEKVLAKEEARENNAGRGKR